MRKDKLKINFQRIGVLCVSFLFVFCCFFAFADSAMASDLPQYNLPERWVHEENPLDNPVFSIAYNCYPGIYDFDFYVMRESIPYSCTSLTVSDLIPGLYSYSAYDGNISVSSYYSYFVFLGDLIPDQLNYGYCYLTDFKFDWSVPSQEFYMFVYQVDNIYQVFYDFSEGSFFASDLNGESFIIASNGVLLDSRFETFDMVSPGTSYSLFFLDSHEILPSFLDRVTSGLTAVIGWVGAVASAVISGPLSPLLGLVAVGIAVSAILLVIFLVRRFIWGA